jgi:hypothetical protein
MKYRGKLGSRRTERRLDGSGVAVERIPVLERGYSVKGVAEYGLMGRAPKNLVVFPHARDLGHAYIAKKPVRVHTGARECVTEYLIACIGEILPLRVAKARLVRLPTAATAPPDVRFMSRFFIHRPHEALVHGVELVAQAFGTSPDDLEREVPKSEERNFYTMDVIDGVLRHAGRAGELENLRTGLAKMLAFDALIGAGDRHLSNWGVVENVLVPGPRAFTPVYDTARGLFLRFSDEDLAREAATEAGRRQFIAGYANKSKPLIGTGAPAANNHFDLMRHLYGRRTDPYGLPARSVIAAFSPELCRRMLHYRFGRLLSRLRLEMIDELLRYRHAELKKIFGLP